jgi:alanyl-tRNA synthetase
MGEAYPEVTNPKIEQVLAKEEQRFAQTINQGMQLLEGAIAKTEGTVLDGEVAFKLHDTYGFPVDLTADVCRERDMTVDMEGFERAMQEQRDKARAAAKFKMAAGLEYEGADTVFTGYTQTKQDGAKVLAVYVDGEQVEEAQAGDDCVIVLDTTPFYGESGGQIGDTGTMKNESTMVRVIDTQKIKGKVWGHHAHVAEGSVKAGDVLNVAIDEARRAAIMRNHSVAHLLHFALREVLGTHVQQKGSWVGEDVMHFDFSHNEAMTAEEIARVEDIVNEHIIANTAVFAEEMGIEDAKKTGALMLFGEKYGDRVRVVKIGPSTEFCGGTHVARTGDIGSFKLLSESGIAAGIRRVEVTTGMHVVRFTRTQEVTLKNVAAELKTPLGLVTEKAHTVFENVKSLEKQLAQLKSQLAVLSAQALVAEAREVNGVKLLVKKVEADSKALRDMAETLRDKIGDAVVVLAAVNDGKVQLVAGVSKSLHARVKAGEVVNTAAQMVGGKGGGKPDLAMAGGTDVAKLDAALAAVAAFIETK